MVTGQENPQVGEPKRATVEKRLPRRNLFQRLFADNIVLKIASLVIAVSLFVVVRGDKGREIEVQVPVVLANIAENDVFVGEMPQTVQVRVRDRWSRLARLLEKNLTPYRVDIRGFTNGSVYVFDREHIKNVLGIEGITVLAVYPSEFTVKTEPKVEKVVPVRLTLVGTARKGYDVPPDKAFGVPDRLRIWGAKTSVEKTTELATYPIDISTLTRDARIDMQLQKPSAPFLYLDADRVRVDIAVREIPGRSSFKEQVVNIRNCPEGYVCRVEPATVSMSLAGPLPTIFRIEDGEIKTQVTVDASDFDSSVERHPGIKPLCDIPSDLECRLQPKSVSLIVSTPEAAARPAAVDTHTHSKSTGR